MSNWWNAARKSNSCVSTSCCFAKKKVQYCEVFYVNVSKKMINDGKFAENVKVQSLSCLLNSVHNSLLLVQMLEYWEHTEKKEEVVERIYLAWCILHILYVIIITYSNSFNGTLADFGDDAGLECSFWLGAAAWQLLLGRRGGWRWRAWSGEQTFHKAFCKASGYDLSRSQADANTSFKLS